MLPCVKTSLNSPEFWTRNASHDAGQWAAFSPFPPRGLNKSRGKQQRSCLPWRMISVWHGTWKTSLLSCTTYLSRFYNGPASPERCCMSGFSEWEMMFCCCWSPKPLLICHGVLGLKISTRLWQHGILFTFFTFEFFCSSPALIRVEIVRDKPLSLWKSDKVRLLYLSREPQQFSPRPKV